MKKAMEELKTKRLAKKIAGVTLGAFALGAVGAVPVYAANELSGGTLDGIEYTGNAPEHAVVIGGASGNASLITDMIIAGMYSDADNVTITGSVVTASDVTTGYYIQEIIGGFGMGADIVGDGNKVNLKNFKVKDNGSIGSIVGFAARPTDQMKTIEAKSTEVELTGLSQVERIIGVEVVEAVADDVTATKTDVTLNDVATDYDVMGVRLHAQKSATSTETTVDITGGSAMEVIGAQLGAEDHNAPTVVGGKVTAKTTNVLLNKTTVASIGQGSGGDVTGVYVENADTADISETKLDITDSEVEDRIAGVYAVANNGAFKKADVKGTTLTLKGTDMKDVDGVSIDATESATAENTTVDITGGSFEQVIGAQLTNYQGGKLEAKTTKVLLNKTTVAQGVKIEGDVTGVSVRAKNVDEVSGTEIEITDSTVGEVIGVYVSSSDPQSPLKKATIKDTKITLDGAKAKNVLGVYLAPTENAEVTNTQIILKGAPSKVEGVIRGNMIYDAQGAPLPIKGAELITENVGNTAVNIAGFDKINFELPVDVKNGDVVLTLTETRDKTDLSAATIKASVAPETQLDIGEKIYLIEKTGAGDLIANLPTDKVALVPTPFDVKNASYGMDAKSGDKVNDLFLAVTDGPTDAQRREIENNAKNVAETQIAAIETLNNANDFIMNDALASAKQAMKNDKDGSAPEDETKKAYSIFAALRGHNMRYNSGSHVDAKGYAGALGMSRMLGNFTFAFAVEHGQANFDSYVDNATGKGKNKYTGASLFTEMRAKNGAHFEAAVRAGRMHSDYDAYLSAAGMGFDTHTDKASKYYGVTVGGGKEFALGEKATLDTYLRYSFTRLGGSDAKMRYTNALGTTYEDAHFDGVTSNVLRLGTRYTRKVNATNDLFFGAAWNYELSGKGKVSIAGNSSPSPSMKGHSALLELGLNSKIGKNIGLDVNVNGWLGKQRGITGGATLSWSFT